MEFDAGSIRLEEGLRELTRGWGARKKVSLYLDRCQVDTPANLVSATWKHVRELRKSIGLVVDFGAGDGRFAAEGSYSKYLGFEIDARRYKHAALPRGAKIKNVCAFSDVVANADVCIGNPPFVRNQDLPKGWRQRASALLKDRTGLSLSGLANAWQYFFLLALTSTGPTGLIALVIPYEWVSRPGAKALREYITDKKWNVSVYRLIDTTFDSVLTTSSITIVDKSKCFGEWSYFEETASGSYRQLPSPTLSSKGIIPYVSRKDASKRKLRAVRGLSPGTQIVLTLTEGERVRADLAIRRDVVPCVTTLRELPRDLKTLNKETFKKYYRNTGQKCWLVRTDKAPSQTLTAYLNSISPDQYQTSTCLEREIWWKFTMPGIADILMSMSFRERFPKGVKNEIKARAVGGVCGIYNVPRRKASMIVDGMGGIDLRKRVVAHSNGLRKIEINQLNALLAEI